MCLSNLGSSHLIVSRSADERGIVMGEFGFITADGIYHVTVYATDEEGKFRIISMKSYPYNGPIGSSEYFGLKNV